MVFLKLEPYVELTVAPHASHKFSFRFFVPFHILEKIGPVTYKLQLPASSAVHPVFHVSQLKWAAPATIQVSHSFPGPDITFQFPEQMLASRAVSQSNAPVHQALIKWSGWLETMATWEDIITLKQRFPFAPTWGQAGLHRGGMLPWLHPPLLKFLGQQMQARLLKLRTQILKAVRLGIRVTRKFRVG
jgi:hypothetical protein